MDRNWKLSGAGLIVLIGLFVINGCDLVSFELADLDSGNKSNASNGQTETPPVQQPPGDAPTQSPFQMVSLAKIHGQKVKETYVARVVAVKDGDTVTVLDSQNQERTIRLAGIDAPEKKQAFGQAAKQELSDWVFNKIITVRKVGSDRYRREIAFLDVDGNDVNASLVWAGYAWEYKQYSKSQDLGGYQADAKAKRRGLWADANPTPPWKFR